MTRRVRRQGRGERTLLEGNLQMSKDVAEPVGNGHANLSAGKASNGRPERYSPPYPPTCGLVNALPNFHGEEGEPGDSWGATARRSRALSVSRPSASQARSISSLRR